MAEIVEYIIFFCLVFWKLKWVVGCSSALILFCAGWGAIWNAMIPFEQDTKTWIDRIVSGFGELL